VTDIAAHLHMRADASRARASRRTHAFSADWRRGRFDRQGVCGLVPCRAHGGGRAGPSTPARRSRRTARGIGAPLFIRLVRRARTDVCSRGVRQSAHRRRRRTDHQRATFQPAAARPTSYSGSGPSNDPDVVSRRLMHIPMARTRDWARAALRWRRYGSVADHNGHSFCGDAGRCMADENSPQGSDSLTQQQSRRAGPDMCTRRRRRRTPTATRRRPHRLAAHRPRRGAARPRYLDRLSPRPETFSPPPRVARSHHRAVGELSRSACGDCQRAEYEADRTQRCRWLEAETPVRGKSRRRRSRRIGVT
jgi:hypothetical protein